MTTDEAAELPTDDARAPLERAGAQDALGHEDRAVPLYRQALEAALAGSRRYQQSVRNSACRLVNPEED